MNDEQNLIELNIKLSEDKQPLEKIIDNIKIAFFDLTYLLIKQQAENYFIQIINIILQFLELMAFPFNPCFIDYWNNKYFIITSDFFQYFQLIHLWNGNTAFYIIAYIITSLFILIFISFIIYVMVKLAHYKLKASWPIKLLDFFFTIDSLIVLPVAKIFLSVFDCQDKVNHYAKGITCYSGPHIALMVVSVLFLLCFGFISVLIHLIYFEFRNKKQNITGKLTSKTEIELLIVKGILLVMFEFLHDYPQVLICFTMLLGIFLLWEYQRYEPYYNEIINQLYVIMHFLFLLASALPFLSLVLITFTHYNGSFALFLLGCPLIIAGHWIMNRRKEEINYLLLSISKISNGYTALQQIKYFLTLIDKQEYNNFHKERLLIAAYIKHYEQSCSDADCPLKKYLITPFTNFKDCKMYLHQHAELLYKNAISRFPLDIKLRLSFGNFIYEKLNKKQKGLLEISNASKNSPNFEEEFFLYKCRKIIDDEGEASNADDNIDYVSALAYKGYMNTFKSFINKIVMLYIDFWQLLLINDESKAENFTKMSELGNKINKCVEEINQNLAKMEKINPNDIEIFRIYSQFLSDILNDQNKATIYNAKLAELEDNKHRYDENNLLSLNFKALSKSEEYKYIVVSAQNDNFGCITNISLNICTMFGFSKNDLLGQALDLIMPEMFQADHKKLLIDKYNMHKQVGMAIKGTTTPNSNDTNGQDQAQLKEVITYGRNKTKYLIPLKLKAGIASTEDGEFYFITKIFEDIHLNREEFQSQVCCILTDNDLMIQNFTANSVKYMNMNSYHMNNSVEITGYIKEYKEELLKLAINNDDQSAVGKGKQMKRLVINKKFRTPNEITWYIGEGVNTPSGNNMGSFKWKSTKNNRHESNESFKCNEELVRPVSKLTGRLAGYSNNATFLAKKFFVNVEDVTILSKQIGYCFKFETSNPYSQNKFRASNSLLTSIKIGESQKYDSNSFNHNQEANNNVRSGIQNSSFAGSNKHLNYIKDQNMGSSIVNAHNVFISNISNEFIPELGSRFNIDVKDLAFKQNNKEEGDIRDELKKMAKSKIQLTSTIITNMSDSNEGSYESSSSSEANKSESNESSEPDSLINNIQVGSQVDVAKKAQVNDSYYHVNLTPIVHFIYNFAKGGVNKIDNPGIGQVEFKIKEKDYPEQDKDFALPTSTDQKDKRGVVVQGPNLPKAENANISENLILIKQIDQALHNKELQPTIINLAIFSFMSFCILIASALICIFSFILVKTNVNMHFELIMKAFSLHQGLIYSIFHVRELVLLASGKYTNVYDSNTERYILNQTQSSLEYFSSNAYTITNISTVFSMLSSKGQEAINNFNISIDALVDELKIKSYSLPIHAAFIELNYALFHTTKLRLVDIKPLNENIFYFMRNSINNSIMNSKDQIDIFLSEFFDTTRECRTLVYTLIATCFVMYVIAYFIFSFFYEAVERRKESYLAVFYEIGKGFIVTSLNKCEKFCQRIQIEQDSESKNISIDSSYYSSVNNDFAPMNQASNPSIELGHGRKGKKYESQNKQNKIKGLLVLSLFGAYILGIFATFLYCMDLFDKYIYFTFYFANYQNDYILLFITLRELMFEPNSYAMHLPIKSKIEDTLYNFYSKRETDQNKVKEYIMYTPEVFQEFYFDAKSGNLCQYALDFNKEYHVSDLDDKAFCSFFISNSTSLGLDAVLSYYIEEIRTMKNVVLNFENFPPEGYRYNNALARSGFEEPHPKNKDALDNDNLYDPFYLFNLDIHQTLLIVHRFIIKKVFLGLTDHLILCLMGSLDAKALGIYVADFVLIGLMAMFYIAIWIPFQINLNETIYKTKNMLSIIPKEVLASLKNIKHMLDIDKSLSPEKKKS